MALHLAGSTGKNTQLEVFRAKIYVHLFLTTEPSRRPHIRWYHTIVPCKCCGSGVELIGGNVGPKDEDGRAAATS